MFGQCSNGRCGIPVAVPAGGPAPIGDPPSDQYEWGLCVGGVWGWKLKADPVANAITQNHGVDTAKIHKAPSYSINGQKCTRAEAFAAAGSKLTDDSGKWNLAVVGEVDFRARVEHDIAALPIEMRAKLHVQFYQPADWPVSLRRLPAGVSLRKPAVNLVGPEVGTVATADYTAAKLLELMASDNGPTPKSKPKPEPKPEPKPDQPTKPDDGTKQPAPTQPENSPMNCLGAFLAVVALLVSMWKRKQQ